jgi:hypothetical protein
VHAVERQSLENDLRHAMERPADVSLHRIASSNAMM